MTAQDTLDVVNRWVAAVNAAKVLDVMRLTAGDIEMRGPQGATRGQPALREWVERVRIELTTKRAFARGEQVVLVQHAVWRDAAGLPVAEAQVVHGFLVEDGVIRRVARHAELLDAFRDTGLTGENEVAVSDSGDEISKGAVSS